jgi:hypothetical protein
LDNVTGNLNVQLHIAVFEQILGSPSARLLIRYSYTFVLRSHSRRAVRHGPSCALPLDNGVIIGSLED